MYNQTQYGAQTYPAQMPYVQSNMPTNMTQSGIDLNQIKSDLVQLLLANQGADEGYRILASDCYGTAQNWITGRINNIVMAIGMTLDYLNATQPQNGLQNNYSIALQEGVAFAWVTTLQNYPQLQNHPTVFPKLHLFQSLQQQKQQRQAQFQQAGLLANHAVQPVPQNMQWNAMNVPQSPGYTSTTYPNNVASMHRSSNTVGLNASSLANNFVSSVPQNQPQPTSQSQYGDVNNNGLSDPDEERERLLQEARMKQTQSVQQPQSPQSSSPYGVYAPLNNVSHVPERKPSVLSDIPVLLETQQGLLDTQARLNAMKKEIHDQLAQGLTEIDLTKVEMWEQIQQANEADKIKETEGLLDDEVKYLSARERDRLLDYGVKFEPPYTARLTANPSRWHLFLTLTTNNQIRQSLVRIGTIPMDRADHADIFNALRKNEVIQRDISNKHTSIITSTKAGMMLNPFKQAPVKLSEEMQALADQLVENPEMDEAEKTHAIRDIFDKYEETVEDDLELASMPPNPQDFDNDELVEYKTKRRDSFIEKSDDTSFLTSSIDTILSEENLDTVSSLKPDNTQHIIERTYMLENVVKVFNSEIELEATKEDLAPFFWEAGKLLPRGEMSGIDLAEKLSKLRQTIDPALFSFINKRVTNTINQAYPYIMNDDNVNVNIIDSFVDDYRDLAEYVGLQLDNEKFPNKAIAWALLETLVLNSLTLFHNENSTEVIIPETESLDYMKLRTLTTKQYVYSTYIPSLPESFGLLDDVTVLTRESHEELYDLATKAFDARYSSYLVDDDNVKNYNGPITESVFTFSDNEQYRIMPLVGTYHDGSGKRHYDSIAFIRIPKLL